MSTLATSQIERHFITNEIYKRSKRYFDVIKLKSIEIVDSKLRRAPSQAHKQQIQKQIQNSFMSSNQYFSKKRTHQIEKSKLKNHSFQTFDDPDQTQTNCTFSTKNHRHIIKAFDMSKSLPRDFYDNCSHQTGCDPFDNFVHSDFSKAERGKSIDFNKILGRRGFAQNSTTNSKTKPISLELNQQNISNQPLINPQIEQVQKISKAYEKFYFDSSQFRCLIDVEKQKKAQQRNNLKTNLENYKSKEISLQKIQKGRAVSQKNQSPGCLMFYHGRGKQQSSSLHNRILKKNENYWAEQLKVMKREDFETVKRREQMVEKRLAQINQRKHIPDIRGQICDAKYFMRNPQ